MEFGSIVDKKNAERAIAELQLVMNDFNDFVATWCKNTGLRPNFAWNFKEGRPLKLASVDAPVWNPKVDMEEVQKKMTASLGDLKKETENQ